jgi:PIN domain nuclease of toxin-antitoxin system
MLNLDTHVLLHAMCGELTARERGLLSKQPWSISSIVLWELAKLAQLGRIDLDIDSADIDLVLTKIHVWPLDLTVCRTIAKLDFRSDPADEIIAATSVAHNVPLLTRDRVILKSKIVPLC